MSDVRQYASTNATPLEAFVPYESMTSYTIHDAFMNLIERARLYPHEVLSVFMLATSFPNRSALLSKFDQLPEDFRRNKYIREALYFIKSYTVDSVAEENLDHNICFMHIPLAGPSICLVTWKMIKPDGHRTLSEFLATPYATQIHLEPQLMEMNREATEEHQWNDLERIWMEQKAHTFKHATPQESLWSTMAGDCYCLPVIKGKNSAKFWLPLRSGMTERGPGEVPYSKEEVEEWLNLPMCLKTIPGSNAEP